MNAAQRKVLSLVQSKLGAIVGRLDTVEQMIADGGDPKALYEAEVEPTIGPLDALQSELQMEADEEQDKFDNLSEGLQQADSGQAIEAAAESLQEAADALENLIQGLKPPTDWAELGDMLISSQDEIQGVIDQIDDATNN